jgi:polyhydroxybutyrate depolymerase
MTSRCRVLALCGAGWLLAACSDSGDSPFSNGGSSGTSSPGGSSGDGGAGGAGAGGSGAGGGGTAGAQGSGNSGTAGIQGSGGSAGAGATTGTGGVAGTSGSAGSAGTAGTAGSAGTGGTSSGCGQADWPQSGEKTIDVAGTNRTYIVTIPSAYASSTPHRLVFAWHGLGGTAQQIASGFRGGYYGLQNLSMGTTIFVAGQGLETSQGGAGWPNTGGRDVAFVRSLLDFMKQNYCIDESRIFSVGMSYGGIMSNTLGCELGDVFRAIAPMAGSGPRLFGGRACVGQVAVWMSHGNMDEVVTFAQGQASRDHWIGSNHCESQTMPTTPSPCVAYQGCDDGHPVTWCEFDGGHTVPSFASQAIWSFFSQF